MANNQIVVLNLEFEFPRQQLPCIRGDCIIY
jgi:hypothetical protein